MAKPFEPGQVVMLANDKLTTFKFVGTLSDGLIVVEYLLYGNVRMLAVKPDRASHPKVKREGWINIYPERASGIRDSTAVYLTEEGAKRGACLNRITTIKIEWEEEA